MFAQEMTETVGLHQCHACSAELRERDRFCRRCGISQRLPVRETKTAPLSVVTNYETRHLALSPGLRRGGSFSGTLIQLVTQSVAEGAAPLRGNRWTMRLIGLLAVVPLWLMIALLSPLEAYLAAKSITTQGATQRG